MSYVTFTNWKFADGFENDDRVIDYATESLKELKEHGAEHSYMVKTSDTDTVIFSIYADEAAYQKAAATLAKRREGAAAGTGGTMMGFMKGKTVIEF